MQIRPLPLTFLLCGFALFSFGFALSSGSIEINFAQLSEIFSGDTSSTPAKVILELRLPRALSAFIVGAMLAVAGALLQVLLRNPLADPYILGISGGAAVAALFAMAAGAGSFIISGSAAFGAIISVFLVFGLARGRGTWSSSRLLLTGVVVAAGWGAIISFILAISPERNLRGMLFWLMGDMSYAGTPGWSIAILIVGLLACLLIARDLNLLARGELQASALGVNVKLVRLLVYFIASLLTATAVSLAGSVGFVGLVVPHLIRLICRADHRVLIPIAALFGGSLLLFADTLARTILAPQQLPVGVLTALLGVPVFLILLQRNAARTS